MRKFIKQKLRESLNSHVIGDATKDNYKLSEYNLPMLSLTKEVDATAEEKKIIKGLNYTDIKFKMEDKKHPFYKIKVSLPLERDLSPGIALDIQLIDYTYFQIHISLAESLRKLGLGYKIYKALIMDTVNFGHLYSGKGRRLNTSEVPRIWEKLNKEKDIMTCVSNDIADICVANSADNKDELLEPFKD